MRHATIHFVIDTAYYSEGNDLIKEMKLLNSSNGPFITYSEVVNLFALLEIILLKLFFCCLKMMASLLRN